MNNFRIPKKVEEKTPYILKELMAYNKAITQLGEMKQITAEPQPSEMSAIRKFITNFIERIQRANLQWKTFEPFALGQNHLSMNDGPFITENEITLVKMREFPAKYEELSINSWNPNFSLGGEQSKPKLAKENVPAFNWQCPFCGVFNAGLEMAIDHRSQCLARRIMEAI